MTRRDDRTQANSAAQATTVRLSAPDRSASAPTPRPAVDDDDAQWVTQRMFDHYNG
jgi:hypothetical protein